MTTADVWECPQDQTIVGASQAIMIELTRQQTNLRGFTASVRFFDPEKAKIGRERARLVSKRQPSSISRSSR